jgi:hypothetical protein
MKWKITILIVFWTLLLGNFASAKISKKVRTDFEATFTPAVPHKGLETAAEPLDIDKLRTFVVVKKGNRIPASRAFYFIAPGEYDYRGAIVDGERIKTRRGEIYTRLQKGLIMAVAGIVYSGRHIYIKLISLKMVRSAQYPKEKPTRVTCMLGFKFNKATLANDDMVKIFSAVDEWIEPFQQYREALKFSETIIPKPIVQE